MIDEIESQMFDVQKCIQLGWSKDFTFWEAWKFVNDYDFLFRKPEFMREKNG